jgi:hypothetical protein
MTTWSEPDARGCTERTVGPFRLEADGQGRWYVYDSDGSIDGGHYLAKPDLASAQAAADAAVEAIHAAMGADLGLVFGPWFTPIDPLSCNSLPARRVAVASDGATYVIYPALSATKVFPWGTWPALTPAGRGSASPS